MSCDSSFSSYCDTICTPTSAVTDALGGDPLRAREILAGVLDIARARGSTTAAGDGKLAALTARAAAARGLTPKTRR